MSDAPKPPLWRQLLFALLPLLLLLVLAEVAVRIVAPETVVEELDKSRGFDEAARYLVPDPAVAGGWKTQIFAEPEREEHIGPKGDARRVLLFGGSNTRGFPQQELERLLDEDALEAGHDYEVINLGREGYGSLRVLYLLQQAMVLEPDVVVIYSGHNEFIELGFRRELEELSSWSDGLLDALSNLRSFALLRQALEPDPGSMPPTNIDRVDPSQIGIPWSLTEEIYERYRQNLADMCDIAHAAGAEVVLSTVISNMVWIPRVWTPREPLPEEEVERIDRLYASSWPATPERFRIERTRLRGTAWRTGGGQRTHADLPRLRPLSGRLSSNPRMAHLPEDDPARIHLWFSPDRWDPAVGTVVDWYGRMVDASPTAAEREQLEVVRRRMQEVLDAVPDEPRCRFVLSYVQYLLGEREQAVAGFRLAATQDRSPNNGNDTSNAVVAAVAAERPWVHFVDAARLFRERCPDGLVSYEIMMDACHLHPGARYVLMQDLADVVQEVALR